MRFPRRLSEILSLSSSITGAKGKGPAENDTENVAFRAVEVVTVKGDGPIPVSFTPRSAPKRVDLSSVREIEYSGAPVAGFV